MIIKIIAVLLLLVPAWLAPEKSGNVSVPGEPYPAYPDFRQQPCSADGDSENPSAGSSQPKVFFREDFEDNDFAARGWYDNTSFVLSAAEAYSGNSCAEFHFKKGNSTSQAGSSLRHLFEESPSVYIRFMIKYSDNWQEQPGGYGHHEFHVLTNQDEPWSGLAFTHLTLYIENHDLEPVLSLQDGSNIDQSQAGADLTGVTEKRSVAGCNGDSDGLGKSTCYKRGNLYWNGKIFKSGSKTIQRGKWHRVEAYFRLNTISNGIGQPDGIIRYWLDGRLLIDHNQVVLRTGQHPAMQFNQFIAAPYQGNGAPQEQTIWIDELVVGSERM